MTIFASEDHVHAIESTMWRALIGADCASKLIGGWIINASVDEVERLEVSGVTQGDIGHRPLAPHHIIKGSSNEKISSRKKH